MNLSAQLNARSLFLLSTPDMFFKKIIDFLEIFEFSKAVSVKISNNLR